MQDLIKRYFWLLGGVVVVVCAIFAARTTSYFIEAKVLADSEHGPKIAAVAAHADAPAAPVHVKDGSQLASRNIFCSDCTPAVDSSKPVDAATGVAITTLPLALLATNVAPDPDESYAT